MREIKFRVWNKIDSQMYPVGILLIDFGASSWNYPIQKEDEYPHASVGTQDGNRVLMQFTGLHDKNGKEIYEGDILNWEDRTSIVEFSDGAFTIFGGEFISDYLNLEIVGNIYENPALVERI